MSGYQGNLLSNAQKGDTVRNAPNLISPKTHDAIIRLFEAVEFQLITDGESWLRGGGELTVRMTIKVDQLNYAGPPKQIRVHSTNNAFFDPKAMAEQLAGILSEYLQGNIAQPHFTGVIKGSMMAHWEKDAKKWLASDIRDDANIFDYLYFQSEEGSKIILDRPFREPLKVDIKFLDGQCNFNLMIYHFSEQAKRVFDVKEVFTYQQKAAAEKKLAPVLVKAIRDKNYCHPYSQDTKNKLLEMAKYIEIAARNIEGVSALALAGAVADALDDNLEERLQRDYALDRRYLLEAVKRHPGISSAIVSLIINLVGGLKGAEVLAAHAGLTWEILDEKQKSEVAEILTEFFYSALNYLGEEISKSVAVGRDEYNDALVIREIGKNIDFSKLNDGQGIELLNEFNKKLDNIMKPSQVLCFYWFGGNSQSGEIIQHAKAIEKMLNGHHKNAIERLSVTKWERFCHYFN